MLPNVEPPEVEPGMGRLQRRRQMFMRQPPMPGTMGGPPGRPPEMDMGRARYGAIKAGLARLGRGGPVRTQPIEGGPAPEIKPPEQFAPPAPAPPEVMPQLPTDGAPAAAGAMDPMQALEELKRRLPPQGPGNPVYY